MKTHYCEELDDATGPNDTAQDVIVSDHRIPKSSWITETLLVGVLVGGLLLLATHADTWSGSPRNDHGIFARWPVRNASLPDNPPRANEGEPSDDQLTDAELRKRDLRDANN